MPCALLILAVRRIVVAADVIERVGLCRLALDKRLSAVPLLPHEPKAIRRIADDRVDRCGVHPRITSRQSPRCSTAFPTTTGVVMPVIWPSAETAPAVPSAPRRAVAGRRPDCRAVTISGLSSQSAAQVRGCCQLNLSAPRRIRPAWA